MKPAARTKLIGAGILLLLLVFFFRGCNPIEPIQRAMSLGDTQTVAKILKSNPSLANKPLRVGRMTPLFYATMCRNPKETIDLLVTSGADINARSGGFNLTPLQQAVWSGKVDAVKALLAHKPDVNAVNSENRTALHYGISVFMNAVFSGSTNNVGKEIMELLLANGADINHGYPILMDASHYGKNTSLMEYLLSKGAKVSVQESSGGETPLNMAIITGNKDLLAMLLRQHPDLKLKGGNYGTALGTAIANQRLDMALMIQSHVLQGKSNTVSFTAAQGSVNDLQDLLVKNPQGINEVDELGFTPLTWAAASGQRAAAEILIAHGAKINTTDQVELNALDWAAFGGHLPVVEFLVTNNSSDLGTALFLAIQQQQIPTAKYLLEHGANPNARYRYSNTTTALHTAVGSGNIEAARLLLEHGAQINALEQNNSTPLEYAVRQTSKEMVEFLFAHGAMIPAKPPGYWSVFHQWALGAGETNIADALLFHKADINAKGSDDQTPLHFAAHQGQLQAVAWLLQHDANVNARDKNGKTPLGLLHGRGGRIMRKDYAELLQKYGGKE